MTIPAAARRSPVRHTQRPRDEYRHGKQAGRETPGTTADQVDLAPRSKPPRTTQAAG